MKKEVKEIYNRIAKKYDKHIQESFYNKDIVDPLFYDLIKEEKLENKKVLDLGCGSGKDSIFLINNKSKVYGIDQSEELLKIAKTKVKDAEFKLGDISKKLPYEDSFFDMVISNLVIHYVLDLSNLFKEINRVLKKNGIFIFSTRNPFAETIEINKNGDISIGDYFKEDKRYLRWPSFNLEMPLYHFKLETLINSLIKSGFTIEKYLDAKPTGRKSTTPKESLCYKIPYDCLFKVRK